MADRLAIVGGGLAGLSTGIHAQKCGYDTVILERHSVPGGVCTSWDREGFEFDGCIHWLMGGVRGHPFHDLYEGCGALDYVTLEPIEHFTTYVDEQSGQSLALTSDLDQLVADVGRISPSDRPLVEDLVQLARRWKGFRPPLDPQPLQWLWSHSRQLYSMLKHRDPVSGWAERAGHRLVREGLFGSLPELPVAFLGAMLAGIEEGSMARVVGGSRAFARGMADHYRALGGELRLDAEVSRILVHDDQAVGVELEDGERIAADRVVSTAPGHTTIFRLLGGNYTTRQIRDMYTSWPVFPGRVMLSVGTARQWPDVPSSQQILLSPPWLLAHQEIRNLTVRTSAAGAGSAPAGGSVIQASFDHDYDFWSELHHTPAAYEQAKRQLAGRLMERLEKWFPSLRYSVHVWDAATPYTFWRFTRAWRGAYEGWLPRAGLLPGGVDKQIDGLGKFHLAGQWVEPGGGVPTVLASGRSVVRDICRLDGRPFDRTERRLAVGGGRF